MEDSAYTVTLAEEEMQHLFDCFVARKKELHLAAAAAGEAGREAQREELLDIYQEVEALQAKILALM